ncbi:MAG: hypothetical protein ABSC90_12820 [Acidimicrobiales bacterium]
MSSRHPNRVAGRRPEELPAEARVLDRVDANAQVLALERPMNP